MLRQWDLPDVCVLGTLSNPFGGPHWLPAEYGFTPAPEIHRRPPNSSRPPSQESSDYPFEDPPSDVDPPPYQTDFDASGVETSEYDNRLSDKLRTDLQAQDQSIISQDSKDFLESGDNYKYKEHLLDFLRALDGALILQEMAGGPRSREGSGFWGKARIELHGPGGYNKSRPEQDAQQSIIGDGIPPKRRAFLEARPHITRIAVDYSHQPDRKGVETSIEQEFFRLIQERRPPNKGSPLYDQAWQTVQASETTEISEPLKSTKKKKRKARKAMAKSSKVLEQENGAQQDVSEWEQAASQSLDDTAPVDEQLSRQGLSSILHALANQIEQDNESELHILAQSALTHVQKIVDLTRPSAKGIAVEEARTQTSKSIGQRVTPSTPTKIEETEVNNFRAHGQDITPVGKRPQSTNVDKSKVNSVKNSLRDVSASPETAPLEPAKSSKADDIQSPQSSIDASKRTPQSKKAEEAKAIDIQSQQQDFNSLLEIQETEQAMIVEQEKVSQQELLPLWHYSLVYGSNINQAIRYKCNSPQWEQDMTSFVSEFLSGTDSNRHGEEIGKRGVPDRATCRLSF